MSTDEKRHLPRQVPEIGNNKVTIPKAFATNVQRIRLVAWTVVALGVLLVGALWAMDAGLKPEKRNGSFRLVEKKTLSCGVKVWFYVPAEHILGDDFVGRGDPAKHIAKTFAGPRRYWRQRFKI